MDNKEGARSRFTDGHDWIDEAVAMLLASPENWRASGSPEQKTPSPVLKGS